MSDVGRIQVLIEGYLQKKSPKNVLGRHVWQKRYFVLTLISADQGDGKIKQQKRLCYYHSQEEAQSGHLPLGVIQLDKIKSIETSPDKNGRFDIKVANRVFALKTENSSELQKWVNSLNAFLDKTKYVKPSQLPDDPSDAMRMMAISPSAYRELNADDTIEMMMKGNAFIKYNHDKVTKHVDRQIVQVFYRRDNTPLGSLYWCEPGPLVEIPSRALPLHSLTDLYLGKQTVAFKTSLTTGVPGEKCLSVVGKVGELNLEGDTKEQIAAWLFGINAIMTKTGVKKVVTVEQTKDGEKIVGSSNGVTLPPRSSPAAAAAAATSASSSKPTPPSRPVPPSLPASTPSSSTSSPSPSSPATPAPTTPSTPSPATSTSVASPTATPTSTSTSTISTTSAAQSAAQSAALQTEVGRWLNGLGSAFSSYAAKFVSNGVDMIFLLSLSDQDLIELGVETNLHRKRILAAIDEIKAKKAPPAPVPVVSAAPAAPVAPSAPAFSSPATAAPSFVPTAPVAPSFVPAAPAAPSLAPAAPSLAPAAPGAPGAPGAPAPPNAPPPPSGGFFASIKSSIMSSKNKKPETPVKTAAPVASPAVVRNPMADIASQIAAVQLRKAQNGSSQGSISAPAAAAPVALPNVADAEGAMTIAAIAARMAQRRAEREKEEKEKREKEEQEQQAREAAAAAAEAAAAAAEAASSNSVNDGSQQVETMDEHEEEERFFQIRASVALTMMQQKQQLDEINNVCNDSGIAEDDEDGEVASDSENDVAEEEEDEDEDN